MNNTFPEPNLSPPDDPVECSYENKECSPLDPCGECLSGLIDEAIERGGW